MARPRVPRTRALVSATLRVLGLVASVILLANVVYESANWGNDGKTYWLSIIAAVVAIFVDGAEVAGLMDTTRNIPRVAPTYLVCEDVAVLCLALPSVFLILFNDLGRSDGFAPEVPWPWADSDRLSWVLTSVICGLRVIILVCSCAECCVAMKHDRRHRNRSQLREPPRELRDTTPGG